MFGVHMELVIIHKGNSRLVIGKQSGDGEVGTKYLRGGRMKLQSFLGHMCHTNVFRLGS